MHNNFVKLVLGLAVAITMVACSGSGGGGNGDGVHSFGDTSKTEEVAKNFNRVQRSASALQGNHSDHGNISASIPDINPDVRMREQMRACSINMRQTQIDPQNPGNFAFGLNVDGSSCPLVADYSFSSAISSSAFSQSFKVHMKIHDHSLANVNDVVAADITGSLSSEGTQDNGSLHGLTSGTISSLKYGTVTLRGTIEGGGSQFQSRVVSTLTITVQQQVTEMVQISDIQNNHQTMAYTINGHTASEAEFKRFLNKLGLLGQAGTTDNQTQASDGDSSDSQTSTPSNPPQPPTQPIPPDHSHPVPPPPDSGPGNEFQCRALVSKAKPYWTLDQVRETCSGADQNCVSGMLTSRQYWTSTQINHVCRNEMAPCSLQVAQLKPYATDGDIVMMCKDTDADCVTRIIRQRPYATPEDIHQFCLP